MDKIALSKRLAGFSEVFKPETKFARDLKAMSMVIENWPEEKFASVLNTLEAHDKANETPEEEEKEKAEEESKEKEAAKKAPEKEEAEPEVKSEEEVEQEEKEEPSKEASNAGSYWNEEASRAVLSFLRKDVLNEDATQRKASEPVKAEKKASETVPAAKLSPSQVPDGKGNKPAPTLKADQVPKQEEVLNSKIVEKSHGAVKKAAEVKKESATAIVSEGVELSPAMEEVSVLSSEDAEKLALLFG